VRVAVIAIKVKQDDGKREKGRKESKKERRIARIICRVTARRGM